MRERAADERAAGSNDVAIDLTLVKDLATALLAGADAATALPAQTGATQPMAQDVPLPAAVPAAPLADQGKAEAADTSARSHAPPISAAATIAQPAPVRDIASSDASPARHEAAVNARPPAPADARTELAVADKAMRAPPARDQSAAAMYVKRGDAMLAIKDISAARKSYEFGANAGSARAATALAETYDPVWLGKLGAIGIRPDPTLAEHWYRRAAALGDPEAGTKQNGSDRH